MSMTFKYKRIERPDPLPSAMSPMIPVTLRARKQLDVLALLDSGADTVAFPKDIAEIIGADLSGKKESVDGVGGQVDAVESRITVIGTSDPATTCTPSFEKGHERYNIRTKAKVILEKRDDFPIIIGRMGFFDNFNITFKEKAKRIVLKKV